MRYYEILKESNDEGYISREFYDWLTSRGYLKIGSGAKQFYRSPKSGKILVVSHPSNNDHMTNWVEFCQQYKTNPHLPKYTPLKPLTFNNPTTGQKEQYLTTFTDELKENRRGPAIEAIENWGYYALNNPNIKFSQVMDRLVRDEGQEQALDLLEEFGGYGSAADLFNTIKNVVATGKKLGYENDLLDDNIMINRQGQFVINDPWANIV